MNDTANKAGSAAGRMLPTDRIAYSAIAERPALKLPGGARMVSMCPVHLGPSLVAMAITLGP